MAKITKTFDYVIPDEYLGQTGTGTASWTYEGPAFLWVFVRNSDGAWLNGQSFIPARTATDQQGPAAIRAGLDETAILLDPANDDTDALIAERGSNYGSPDVFFAQLAKAKEGITGIPTSASREVGYMLLFKVIRYINNPSHIDSLDDIEGYARIGKMLANNKQDQDMQEE